METTTILVGPANSGALSHVPFVASFVDKARDKDNWESGRIPRSIAVAILTGMLLACGGGEAAVAGVESPGLAPVQSGCEPDYPPYCIVTPDNQADGFSVELFRAALKTVGRDVAFKTGPWAEIKQDLADGRIHALPMVGRTPEREAVYDFTFPYLTMHGAIVVREDNIDIHVPEDLKGKSVAVLQGDNAEEYLRRANLGAVVVPLSSFETALRDLSAGQCDAVVIQRLLAFQLMQKAGLTNLRVAGAPLKDFPQNFCFAVRKGDSGLLSELNEGLSIAMADGTFRRLHAKWFSAIEAAGRAKSWIVVGGDSAYPPYEFLDANGQPAGYNVDLTRAIARQMGLAVDIRLDSWSAIRNGLEQGRIDAVQGMFYSAERDETFDFSPAHEVVQHAIVVRKGSPALSGMTDLAGKRILVMAGDVMEDLAVKLGYERQLVAVPSQKDALRRLAAGENDCALVAKLPALYWIKQHGWRNLTVSGQAVLSAEYCFALPHGNEALLSQLSEGLAALKTTGEYRTIQTRWLGSYEARGMDLRTVIKLALAVSLPLLALLAGSLLWSHSLKRQVAARTRDLLSERAFLDRIINAIADPVFVKDDKRRFVIVNDAMCAIVGRPRETLIGEDGDDMFPPAQVAIFRKMDAAVLETGEENLNEEYLSDLSTGEVRTIVTRKSRYIDPDGKRFLVGVIRDFTELKQAEATLRESHKLIEGIVNAIPARVFWKDENLLYLGCNAIFARDAGFADPRDIIGKDDYQMAWRDQAELYRADDRSVIASGRPRLLIEEPQTTPSGDTIWLLTNKVPLRDSTGEIRGMLGAYLDVTEQKRAQAERRELEMQLLEKQKLASVGTLARGMAHEINNPIMGIANYAQLIKDRAADDAGLAGFADEILAESQRVALMTHSLLSFTQQDSTQEMASAVLTDIVASVLVSVVETARQRGIDLSTDIPTDLPTVSCRQRQMGEVVAALLANAVEAWEGGAPDPAGPEAMQGRRVDGEPKAIRLTAERLGKDGQAWVRLTVEDNGPLIPVGIRERVFDPFFTTKNRTRHAGLGLWVSLSIVHDHDGEMTLESEPGSWTRFHVDLPVERPRPA